jgi:hypothetical protein
MTTLAMWTVYDNPNDYPGKFVARLFVVSATGPMATESIVIMDDLEAMREMLAFEMHLTCLARSPEDDPKIVETWL